MLKEKHARSCSAGLQDGSAQRDLLQHLPRTSGGGKGSESEPRSANREAKTAPLKAVIWLWTAGMATNSGNGKCGKKKQLVPALLCPRSLPRARAHGVRPLAPAPDLQPLGAKPGLVQRGLECCCQWDRQRAWGGPSGLSWSSICTLSLDKAPPGITGGGTEEHQRCVPTPPLGP